MAVPTITTVTPSAGHTGGRTLVEIVGTGFREPVDRPAVNGKVPEAFASMRVFFGDVEATHVQVCANDLLYCLTPVHDPGAVDVRVENLDSAQAILDIGAGNFTGFADGMTLELLVGEEACEITIHTADFVSIAAATSAEMAAVCNRFLRGAKAIVYSGSVQIVSDATGPEARIEVLGGTLLSASLTVDEGDVATGSDDRTPITTETATRTNAFTFALPDLGAQSELERVIGAFILELRRQVIENVSWTTHTDYDLETGDQLNIAHLAKFPALILAGVDLPENTSHADREPYTVQVDEETFVERRPATVVDIVMQLIGVSNNPMELLRLAQITRLFFKKNPKLVLARDPNDASKGTIKYDLHWSLGTSISVSGTTPDGANVQSFTGGATIVGVRLEDIPGFTSGVPGAPTSTDQEATTELGKTADTIDVSVGKLSLEG